MEEGRGARKLLGSPGQARWLPRTWHRRPLPGPTRPGTRVIWASLRGARGTPGATQGETTLPEAAAFPPSLNNCLLQGKELPFPFPTHACQGIWTLRAGHNRGEGGWLGLGYRQGGTGSEISLLKSLYHLPELLFAPSSPLPRPANIHFNTQTPQRAACVPAGVQGSS